MLSKDNIAELVEDYDRMKLRIGMTASHSALDICDGAIEEGFPTVAYCKEGRHKTYANYFKAHRSPSGRVFRGMVDKAIVMPSFNDPEISNPRTFGIFIDIGCPNMAASASIPPTPQPRTDKALTMVVWLSVPTTESG